MRQLVLLICLLLPLGCLAQLNLKDVRKNSWQTYAYRIPAADAILFEQWDSIPVERFVNANIFRTVASDKWFKDELPVGHYVLLSVENNMLKAELYNRSELSILTVNNGQQLQLAVRNVSGSVVAANKILVDGKEALFNEKTQTYWVKERGFEDATAVVFSAGDTLIAFLSAADELSNSLSRQKRINYRGSTFYKIINWLPQKFSSLSRPKRKSSNIQASGFIIFNQPKYKPLDTLKFKGYVVNRKWKQYNEKINVFIEYRARDKFQSQLVAVLEPTSPGAYVSQFVIADSMPSDIGCVLVFKTSSGKQIIKELFKIEDYVLEEIGTVSFRSQKETYFRNDTLRFYASAKDANGLNVLDATARLVLTTAKIDNFYGDSVFVADTLFNQEIKLATDNETTFLVAPPFPKADISIAAKLVLKNGNNELQYKSTYVDYLHESKKLFVHQDADSIRAVFVKNGVEQTAPGEVSMNYDKDVAITYPYAAKINPIAEDYYFYYADEKDTLSDGIAISGNYNVALSRVSRGDTLGFTLSNPYKVPVYYSVFNGNTIIATGADSTQQISWRKLMNDRRRMYKVKWQYYWAGEEHNREESIGLLYKLLNITIDSKSTVFPGQDDSIRIDVKDYLGRPAAAVNLTALSYNNQLSKDIRVKDPPYLVKYKSKKALLHDAVRADAVDGSIVAKKYLIQHHKSWVNKFGLDTMEYYKLLMPAGKYYDAVRPVSSIIPQVSVNVVDRAVPQEIYLLYLNRQLVYYNGTTDRPAYAFEVAPGYVQVGIRLRNKFIQIDSLYIQPFYKHDISFDLNNLPKHALVKATDTSWTDFEKSLLEKKMWQMQNDPVNNAAWIWQGKSLIKLDGNREHIAGPFQQNEPMHFYKPGGFDMKFLFEPGYQYKLTKDIARLEKKPLFPRNDIKYFLPVKLAQLKLGDTLLNIPEINYSLAPPLPELRLSPNDHSYYYQQNPIGGKIIYRVPKDSVIKYCVLLQKDSVPLVTRGYFTALHNLHAGSYEMLLVTASMGVYATPVVEVKPGTTLCLRVTEGNYRQHHPAILQLLKERDTLARSQENESPVKMVLLPPQSNLIPDSVLFVKTGGGSIAGIVKDKKGDKPIPFCTIQIVNTNTAVVTDVNGRFELNNLRIGNYTLLVSQVGYAPREIDVSVFPGDGSFLIFFLELGEQNLEEVVVTAYGVQRKSRSVGYATVQINGSDLSLVNSNVANGLQGKVSGLSVTSVSDTEASNRMLLRGVRSLAGDNEPLLVVDGITSPLSSLSAINPRDILEVKILKSEEAVSLFGSRAINGAIVVTTKMQTNRTAFRDYAFWAPNFFTNSQGKASLHVKYPDNITGWKTFVVAVDKKRRIGKSSTLTQAYKPMQAQLNLPLFLIEGDSSYFVTKSINHTADTYRVKTSFSAYGKLISQKEKNLLPNDAAVNAELVAANADDSLKVSFALESTTGFKDGEQRQIPVLKKGVEETVGNFWMLQGDTTIQFDAKPGMTGVTLFAHSSTLDVMLEELQNLRRYPYFCMEQICSKITGLTLEKRINEYLKRPFNQGPELEALLKKLQKAQQFDGGWAWWENGKSNVYISNYISNALLQNADNPLLQASIRNAYLYLQNRLPYLSKDELIASLATLSNGGHEMNYTVWLNKIDYDSLHQHQQWQWVKIRQQQKLNYNAALQALIGKKTETMLGGVHWGEDNYRWYSNDVATTIIAFEVLQKEAAFQHLLPRIIQYFLEKKRNGYFRNTVEAATILNTILPTLLKNQADFQTGTRLTVSGDTNFTVSRFPYELQMKNSSVQNISVGKQGGGMLYLTAHQTFFNGNPTPATDKFVVRTFFQNNGSVMAAIKTGERVTMVVEVEVLKDAEYVMLSVPIPAGCIFTNKTNSDWRIFKEYRKDKLLLFAETLGKGSHRFEVELEARYQGSYSLNPAVAELMYFPTFFGRNAPRKISLEK